MGLAMISAIKDFDEDRHESVNMRVGIHTGTVLCGIVGKRRFKFDVWSNDVSLANKMESSGKPGMVHVSEKTYKFLKDEYFVQEGDPIKGEFAEFTTLVSTKYETPSNGLTRLFLRCSCHELIRLMNLKLASCCILQLDPWSLFAVFMA